MTPQTISEWHHSPDFQAALNALQMDQLEAARTALQALARDAARTLSDVMHNADSHETRRRAALDILEMTGLAADTTRFAWGIGSQTPQAVEKDARRRNREASLLDELVGL